MPDTRLSRAGDKGALTELWQAVFGDNAELISAFFSLLCRPEYCRIACAGGKIASMGFCLPGPEAMGLKCAYIYAMATAEDARGRGLAAAVGSALIEDAFSRGTDIVATLPADEGLCAWYETRFGMSPLFKKGGPGVVFPDNWLEFARICGGHDPDTPQRLYAVARGGIDTAGLEDLGWELTFD
ncbi:MAG TPA: GNAT family N-acetyltransferase [Candidatus Scatomorpha intestinavium]|uniref:GNAT family N-acetyltransferase n=1 Tax=Candidatus Scatomorpha intestinavium TaxID=2840922 RepID=A0A9D1CS78_9FIRM|nr:GNAT family N-acetyltransferase [Candidatus Scatomorpha intestinavium]